MKFSQKNSKYLVCLLSVIVSIYITQYNINAYALSYVDGFSIVKGELTYKYESSGTAYDKYYDDVTTEKYTYKPSDNNYYNYMYNMDVTITPSDINNPDIHRTNIYTNDLEYWVGNYSEVYSDNSWSEKSNSTYTYSYTCPNGIPMDDFTGVSLSTAKDPDKDYSKLKINDNLPSEPIYDDGHGYLWFYYNLPLPGCGGTITVTPSIDGNRISSGKIHIGGGVTCDGLSITNLAIDKMGDQYKITGNISTPKYTTWVLELPNGTTVEGDGNSVDVTWDGKGSNGKPVGTGTYTVTLNAYTNGDRCAAPVPGKASIDIIAACDLKIPTLKGDNDKLDPKVGGKINITGTITYSANEAVYWTLNILDKSVTDVGLEVSAPWDGKYADGSVVKPGKYQAKLSAKTQDGLCTAEGSTDVTVIPHPDDPCKSLYVQFGSSANLTNGNISHSQVLFSATGGVAPVGLTLYYNSLDSSGGPLGLSWGHNYEYSIEENDDGSVLINEPNGIQKYFTSLNGAYVGQPGDTSTLVKNGDGTFALTFMDGTVMKFDVDGRIVAIADHNGNTTTLAYGSGNLSTVSDPSGRVVSFAYDTNNHLSSFSDPNGNVYRFAYTDDNLISVTHPDGGQWNYTYDQYNYLLTKTDPGGNKTSYTYDDNHRALSVTDPEEVARWLTYPKDQPGNTLVTSFTEKDGGLWKYTYDTVAGTLTSKTDALGNTTSYTYDANGNRTGMTDPNNATTTYVFDANNNITSVTDALNNTTTYTYNANGQVLTQTMPAGTATNTSSGNPSPPSTVTITNTYDGSGNLLTSTDPAGATTTYQYDAKGNLTTITNANNQTTTIAYNPAGFLASVTDPANAVTSFTYDANGNMLTLTDSLGKVTTYTYDGMNRVATITDPLKNITTYAYDRMGNRISQIDANGAASTYTYNYQKQMTTVIDALGNTTSYAYGATGCPSCGGGVDKLTSLTDAKRQATTWQYDQLGHLTKETDPLQKNTAYGYDKVGNMTLKTDANGSATSYSYDALKRLTGKTYPDTTTVNYTYDTAGRLWTATNPNVSYTYGYDAGGRMTSATDSRGYVLNYEYDAIGNRTKTTLKPGTPDQRIINYTYDDANRISTITSPAGTFTYGYDTLGRRTSLAYPNQTAATYSYDSASRLTGIRHSAGTTTIAFASYSTFDKTGNRKSKTTNSGTEQYTYDAIYRLTQAITPKGTENYSYDAVGNRLTGPGAKDISYLYNVGNQMTQGRQLGYSYDNNGNQTARSMSAATDKGWNLTWDFENRLTKMEKAKGPTEKQTFIFKYDPFGRRIEKDLATTIDGVTKTSSWVYVYDSDNIALEIYTNPAGAVEKTFYTHGAGTDEHLALERGGSYYYYHADGLGSVTAITDAGRNVVQTYSYDSFGMVKASTSFRNSYTYTGREWDKETGLYYNRLRYYDPMDGRFVSRDPIGFAGGDMNLYGYVQNNGINFRDPYGEDVRDYVIGKIADKILGKIDPFGLWNFLKSLSGPDDTTKTLNYLHKQCEIAYDNHDTERAEIYEEAIAGINKILEEQIMDVTKNVPKGTSLSGPIASPRK